MGKLRKDENDEETFDQFKSSMRAEKPDTAKYASFFDLDDILAHISVNMSTRTHHGTTFLLTRKGWAS
jgi:hypothetical protein